MKSVAIQILIIMMAAVFFFIVFLSIIPHFINNFDPIPWLTMVVGAAFGLIIAIIVNHNSNEALGFLKKSEIRRRQIGLTIIEFAIKDLIDSREIYFKILKRSNELKTREKRVNFQRFLPTFKGVLARIHDAIPLLSESIDHKLHKQVERSLLKLSILFIILESGSDDKFEKNIEKFPIYSSELKTRLDKIS